MRLICPCLRHLYLTLSSIYQMRSSTKCSQKLYLSTKGGCHAPYVSYIGFVEQIITYAGSANTHTVDLYAAVQIRVLVAQVYNVNSLSAKFISANIRNEMSCTMSGNCGLAVAMHLKRSMISP